MQPIHHNRNCAYHLQGITHLPAGKMPKVKSYNAPWLSKKSPGHQLFEPSSAHGRSRTTTPGIGSKGRLHLGPKRTIARRGTEVFVACGKEIRWGDLAYIKEEYNSRQPRGKSGSSGGRMQRDDTLQSIESEADGAALGMRVSCSGTR